MTRFSEANLVPFIRRDSSENKGVKLRFIPDIFYLLFFFQYQERPVDGSTPISEDAGVWISTTEKPRLIGYDIAVLWKVIILRFSL